MARTELESKIEDFLQRNLPASLDLLHQMVDINSFTANPTGINVLGDLTAEAFTDLGFASEKIQSVRPDYGDHLVLTRTGTSDRRIGLVSHLDTVFPPEEETRNDFAWRVDGDRIYGPGTVDIKGGTVLIYMVLAALREFAADLFEEITWVVLVDASEESGGEDFGALCQERLGDGKAIAALIFEGGYQDKDEFWLVRCRKGMAVYEVNVEGKSAHAGTAHQNGANAIVQMAHTIQQLASITDYEKRITLNVGVVTGGTVTNRVPHHAQAFLEMRTFEPDLFQGAMDEISSQSGNSVVSSGDDKYQCTVSVECLRVTEPWPPTAETDRLIGIWEEAAGQLGFRIKREERGGLSDGNHFWRYVPTLDGLGVSGGNAHCSERADDGSKDQEFCLISSFVPKALLNVMGIMRLVQAEGG